MNNAAKELIEQLIVESDYFKKAQIVDLLRRQECISVKDIATKIHKHPSYVSHINRLLRLPPLVIDGYYGGHISLSHLVILSRLKNKEKMEDVYKKILAEGLTSQQTEELIRLKNFDITSEPEKASTSDIDMLVDEIKAKLHGVDIKVIQTRIKGKIVLELKGSSRQTTDFLLEVLHSISNQRTTRQGPTEALMILE